MLSLHAVTNNSANISDNCCCGVCVCEWGVQNVSLVFFLCTLFPVASRLIGITTNYTFTCLQVFAVLTAKSPPIQRPSHPKRVLMYDDT